MTVTFKTDGSATRLDFKHEDMFDEVDRDNHSFRWIRALDNLAHEVAHVLVWLIPVLFKKGEGPMLKKILIALAVVLIAFAILVMTQPNSFNVSRSITIAAPATVVFDKVNDFHAWGDWSPWEKLDPKMDRKYEGPTTGVGSVYRWVSDNSSVGTGSMTIIESRPGELVKTKLDFTKPFEGTNTAQFAFKQDGDKTTVTWSMTGQTCFIAKIFGVFMNMDKMIGPEFEKGLASLKTVSESAKIK